MAEEDFLVELFAGADAGVLDLDVRALLEAREADEVVGEVHDLYGLAHVEHEELAPLAERAGLEHELHDLGDGRGGFRPSDGTEW